MPGSVGKTKGALSSGGKTAPMFPNKGRKPFVCPQKKNEFDAISEEESEI